MSAPSNGPRCPACDGPATGNFCQHCGAELGGRFCNQCGSQAAPGAKFCNQCGSQFAGGATRTRGAGPETSAGARAGGRATLARATVGENLPWWIAGGALFAVIVVLGVNMVQPGPAAPPNAAMPTAASSASGAGGAPPDISQMSPIEAADRLFSRVMMSVSQGDSAQAQAFVPMAIAAYQRAQPLNLDGLFHLSMLNRTAMNLEAALDNALEILETDPDHLLGLAAAAEAAIELGLPDEAADHYRHLADVYAAEMAAPLEEYVAHQAIVDVVDEDAQRYLAGR